MLYNRLKFLKRDRQPLLRTTGGQIIVEYVLLLIISVAISTLFVKQLTSRDPDSAGVLTAKWAQILSEIAKDNPDCSNTYRSTHGVPSPCPSRP